MIFLSSVLACLVGNFFVAVDIVRSVWLSLGIVRFIWDGYWTKVMTPCCGKEEQMCLGRQHVCTLYDNLNLLDTQLDVANVYQ